MGWTWGRLGWLAWPGIALGATHRKSTKIEYSFSRAPKCGSGPNCPLEGHPLFPPLQLEDPSLKPQPFRPHPPPSSSPHPAALSAMLWEGVAQAGVGWKRRGRALQAALGARPASGGAQVLRQGTPNQVMFGLQSSWQVRAQCFSISASCPRVRLLPWPSAPLSCLCLFHASVSKSFLEGCRPERADSRESTLQETAPPPLKDLTQAALNGDKPKGKTEHFRWFLQIFWPFPRKQSTWETQIFAENRRTPQEPAENRRLAFVPLGSSPYAPPRPT